MQIIVPGKDSADRHPFESLTRNRQEFAKAVNGVIRIVHQSFIEDAKRTSVDHVRRVRTEREEKRRTDICGKWFRRFRGDLGFGLIKTLDELPKALRAELDGAKYTPPAAGRLWVPGGSQ